MGTVITQISVAMVERATPKKATVRRLSASIFRIFGSSEVGVGVGVRPLPMDFIWLEKGKAN
jgi:hypothetical protein